MRHQREEKQVSEDREQNTSEDREQNTNDVEGHNLPGNLVGQTAAQQIDAADEDEPDVEGHALVGQNADETEQDAGAQIGANTSDPTDANIA
jgi:hypothetical protein